MLPVLVWLAGCVFCGWAIWHLGYAREAVAYTLCTCGMLWIVGGALWIGRKLQAGAAALQVSARNGASLGRVPLSNREREELNRLHEEQPR